MRSKKWREKVSVFVMDFKQREFYLFSKARNERNLMFLIPELSQHFFERHEKILSCLLTFFPVHDLLHIPPLFTHSSASQNRTVDFDLIVCEIPEQFDSRNLITCPRINQEPRINQGREFKDFWSLLLSSWFSKLKLLNKAQISPGGNIAFGLNKAIIIYHN